MRKLVYLSFEDMKASLQHGEKFLTFDSGYITIIDTAGNIIAEFTTGPQGQIWEDTTGIKSTPPSGYYRVTNLYVDPSTGKMIVKYDDTPA